MIATSPKMTTNAGMPNASASTQPPSPFVLINASGDTFTPTRSGSLGPWVWEVCNAALADGIRPFVISKRGPADPYDWPDKSIIDWPPVRKDRLSVFGYRAYRKLTRWPEFGMRTFADNVVAAIRQHGLQRSAFFLQNDPELTVYLRQKFPNARIVSHFQNEHGALDRFKARFPASADVVTACSAFTARKIEQIYHLPPNSVVTLHSGVNANYFVPPADRPRRKPVVGFVSRMVIEKAPDLFLKALCDVAAKTKDFSVVLAGASAPQRIQLNAFEQFIEKLIDQLRSLGIEVNWLGHVGRPDIVRVLQSIDIHVMPARWDEPFGLVTLEGMACGCATIASRTGGTPEVAGDAAMLFNRENQPELASHLHRLITDDQTRNHFSNVGRQWAETFTWGRTWTQLRGLIQQTDF